MSFAQLKKSSGKFDQLQTELEKLNKLFFRIAICIEKMVFGNMCKLFPTVIKMRVCRGGCVVIR